MTGSSGFSEIEFEELYDEVRELMGQRSGPGNLSRMNFSEGYLGKEAEDTKIVRRGKRSAAAAESFYGEAPPASPRIRDSNEWIAGRDVNLHYGSELHPSEFPDGFEEVEISVDQRVKKFESCNSSWEDTKEITKIIDRRESALFRDVGLFTILPAAKSVEMHWRRIFLHPDDFDTRHFSIPKAIRAIISSSLVANSEKSPCYESGIHPKPLVCPGGPIWEDLRENIVKDDGSEKFQQLIDLTEKIFYRGHEYRHSQISEWKEIKPVYTQISELMRVLQDTLKDLIGPKWH